MVEEAGEPNSWRLLEERPCSGEADKGEAARFEQIVGRQRAAARGVMPAAANDRKMMSASVEKRFRMKANAPT